MGVEETFQGERVLGEGGMWFLWIIWWAQRMELPDSKFWFLTLAHWKINRLFRGVFPSISSFRQDFFWVSKRISGLGWNKEVTQEKIISRSNITLANSGDLRLIQFFDFKWEMLYPIRSSLSLQNNSFVSVKLM